jgi:hypothetical protein
VKVKDRKLKRPTIDDGNEIKENEIKENEMNTLGISAIGL